MTDEQINIAIAKACGWEHKPTNCGGADFCTDLNAMHEAEKVLGKKLSQYGEWLCEMTEINIDDRPSCYIWHATARQRAEAFLRTLGKWEEEAK